MKLTTLTEKQKEQKEVVKNYWINKALYEKDEVDREKASIIKHYYKKAGLKEPKILVVGSPMGIQYCANLLNRNEVRNDVKTEVDNEVWREVNNEVDNEVGGEVLNEVWREVNNEVRNEVGREVGNEVENEVWNEVRNEVSNEVWNEVSNEARNEVMIEVSNEVWNEVENEVWNEVWNEVENEVEKEVEKSKLKYYSFSWKDLSNVGWVAFYDYFLKQDIYSRKTKKSFEKYLEYLDSGVFMSVLLNGYAIFCPRPKKCRKNLTGRLHSDEFPAIEWRDGYKIYALNGVRFDEKLWTKVVSKKMSLKEVMAIEDIDQRTQAMKYVEV